VDEEPPFSALVRRIFIAGCNNTIDDAGEVIANDGSNFPEGVTGGGTDADAEDLAPDFAVHSELLVDEEPPFSALVRRIFIAGCNNTIDDAGEVKAEGPREVSLESVVASNSTL